MAMKTRIALDSMVFIYHFERTEAYFHQVQEILLSAQEGKSELITSVISIAEVLSAPKYIHLPEIVKEINYFFMETEFLKIMGFDWDIASETANLRRENKYLRMPDAIQLATAVVSGAKLFVTNDKQLRKIKIFSAKIKVVGLEDF